MPVEFEELQLPFDLVDGEPVDTAPPAPPAPIAPSAPEVPVCRVNRDPMGTFPCCPLCGGEMRPEHAHYRCSCGWRDSCCD